MGYPYEFKREDAERFASFVGIKANISGDELIFRYCPYCNQRSTGKDKNKFSINLKTGQYNCFRSSCNAHGNMITLARDFNFELTKDFENYYRPKKQYRTFKKPAEPIVPKEPAIAYLEKRGISESTAKRYEITTTKDRDNVLVFPFYDDAGNLVSIKYRKTDFDKEKDNAKEWFEKDCKPILFGMKQCNAENKTIVLTEGQLDSLAVAESGIENAVSVPTGANGFTWVPFCWDWVHKFKRIVVFGDHEKGHITLLDEISKRFSLEIFHVREEDYLDCKDANEILLKHGKEQVRKCVENSVRIPIKEIVDLADVEDVDIFNLEKLQSGIRELDRLLYGGIPFGGVILISGKAGEGKLLADDTPVFTKNGWKKHGDLKVGDQVIGRYGDFVKVTHVFPKQYANMKVTFNNNEVIYCHENHEWVTDFHSGNGYKERILQTNEIKDWLQRVSCHPARIISREPLKGIESELYVKPYTLGAWLGDGRNKNPDICASKQDYCVIERVLKDGYEIAWETEHKKTGVLYTAFKELRFQLRKYGMCHSKKKLKKHIPHEYLIAPLNERLELLAGLLDTDGYYDQEKHSYTFATAEEELKDSFVDLIHTFGWNCGCTSQKPRKSSSGIQGKQIVYRISFVPTGLTIPCVIERKKQNVFKAYSKKRTAIKKIEYCENMQGNCIEVEGGVYCVGKTMIPTHNSTLASQIMINAREQGYKCFAYSGELPNYLFKGWMSFQVAGRGHVFEYKNDLFGDINYNISDINKRIISEWYRDYMFIYDNNVVDTQDTKGLVEVTERVIQQYGVRVILLDNLMTAMTMDKSRMSDTYERQTEFVNKLRHLAVKYNVVILLVAHKRKNNFSSNENDEIAGSSNIANLAMLTIAYEKDKELPESKRLLKVSKNRLFGKVNTDGYIVSYDEKSKRIYGNGDNLDKEFSCFADGEVKQQDKFMDLSEFEDADELIFE